MHLAELDDIRRRIASDGWSTLTLPNEIDLRVVVQLLRPAFTGQVGVERLSPKRSDQARPGTLSALYGLGPFPFHTERAHWVRPPRYIVFRSVGQPTDRPTTLLDSYQLASMVDLVRRLHDVPWRIAWDDISFETHVLVPTSRAIWQIRYDQCCMTVCNLEHIDLQFQLSAALGSMTALSHYWTPGVALVIDNWRVLHGRGASATSDYSRVLERVVVP